MAVVGEFLLFPMFVFELFESDPGELSLGQCVPWQDLAP